MMNTIRMIAIVLPVMLLMACGGGGGGGAAAPTTPPTNMPDMPGPIMLEDLPTALIADAATARSHVSGSTQTTSTSAQIQQMFRSRASNGNRLVASDVYLKPSGTGGVNTPTNCSVRSCDDITIEGNTFTISLDDIATNIGDRFELTGVDFEYTPVMGHQGVTLAQYRGAGRDDGDVFEYLSYGGWLTDSAFSVDILTINPGSNESSLLVAATYGSATGSRPTGSSSAQWFGSVVGVHKSNRDVIQGELEVTIGDVASNNTSIDIIQFKNLRNINNGNTITSTTSSQWLGIPIAVNGTFTGTTNGNDINGAFYGTGHTEVGGTFSWNDFTGAFGGTRQ
ncbi:MAG: hypothetical protein OXF09_03560 [Hyphomicrobiales bacterium]|nr:hypothetical protein [Hyphomicrobiales bacterium]